MPVENGAFLVQAGLSEKQWVTCVHVVVYTSEVKWYTEPRGGAVWLCGPKPPPLVLRPFLGKLLIIFLLPRSGS